MPDRRDIGPILYSLFLLFIAAIEFRASSASHVITSVALEMIIVHVQYIYVLLQYF